MITGHGFELSLLASFLERRPSLFSGVDLRVRKTAGGWFADQEKGMRRLQAVDARIVDAGAGTLMQQVEWSDAVIFSSTTAGIEAMLAGRLAVYAALHDVFEADPLLGHDWAFARCEDADSLAAALARAAALPDAEYDAAVERQRAFASRILSPLDITRLAAPPGGLAEDATFRAGAAAHA